MDEDPDSTEISSTINDETDSFSSYDADISSPEEENHNNYFALNHIYNLRSQVLKDDVINVMKLTEENSLEAANQMYEKIVSLLNNKTIIQIQIYGIGVLDGTCQNRGPFQLSIVFSLLNRFKEFFPKITVTCQEPKLVDSEKEYLQSKNVKIFETLKFSSKHFLKALKSTKNIISDPAFICYMIHGAYKIRCIIVGNNPDIFIDSTDLMYSKYSEKLKEFSKLCESKPLKFEKDSVGDTGIGHKTCIYTISKENAEALICKFP
uniref:SRR1-like domain-containing protein n=1 Tax=Panagrolaimus sp. ES5 TaxID=591445 RepID=A0AC34FT24_9BILA